MGQVIGANPYYSDPASNSEPVALGRVATDTRTVKRYLAEPPKPLNTETERPPP